MAEYVLFVGLNFPAPGQGPLGQAAEADREGIRAEAGEIRSDLPAHFTGECSADCPHADGHGWGLRDGIIALAGPVVDVTTLGDPSPRFIAIPWHGARSAVYHTAAACKLGNNIEPENRVEGDGGLDPCAECARLARKGA